MHSKSPTELALAWYSVEVVKRYRDTYLCSLMVARRTVLDLAIDEAFKHVAGWEDLKAIMLFQREHRIP